MNDEQRKNLLSGTKDWSGEWFHTGGGWTADGIHDGFTVMSRKGAWYGLYKPVKLVAGQTYTFSACVKVEPGQNHVAAIYLASGTVNDTVLAVSEIDEHARGFHDVADGGWHIISHTFTPTASKCVIARVEANGDFALSVCAYMLVEGSTPAAWAPAEGETLTADGGGDMTEPTNLVKTQPDETATYTVEANDGHGHKDVLYSDLGDGNIKLSANTSLHIGITIKPDKDIPSGHVWSWISYKDDAGAGNFANSSKASYVIPAGVWRRLEWTVTVPAGMTVIGAALSIDYSADETKFQATNFAVYPLVMWVGGGDMTEPTNLVKTQPDETATYMVKATVDGDGRHKDFLNSAIGDGNIKLSANTSLHIGITIKPDKDIPSGHVWSCIFYYKDDTGARNFANSSKISYVIPAGVWTRLEWTVTVPAGMILWLSAISIDSLSDETKFQATNFVVYPLPAAASSGREGRRSKRR